MDAEMGQRLIAIAKAATVQMKWQYLGVLQPGDENTRLYQDLQKKLQSMRDATGSKRIYVFDLEGRSLVDSQDDVPIGTLYRFLDADQIHIEQAKRGNAAFSTSFHGKDDAFYKSAYVPIQEEEGIGKRGNISAVLAVDASVLFLETMENMRRNLIITGIMGMFAAIALSALFARSIVIPIKKLSRAAQQIKEGNLGAQVDSYSGDEVGMLADTFNEMSVAINERDKRLSRLNEELKQMSAGLAHEVRNPLNGMRIFLELIRRQYASDKKASEMIERVDNEVQALNRIVTEFLDFARPAPLEWDMVVNLSDVIGTVLALLSPELDDVVVQIHTYGLESLPPIRTDAEQLKRVFTNIIKNAIQAMPYGGALNISGKAIPMENIINIEFADTGIGIPQDVLERIFDPFFTTRNTGTGLGLAVVKRLLEDLSGAIGCRSEVGKGATFIVTLPIRREEIEKDKS